MLTYLQMEQKLRCTHHCLLGFWKCWFLPTKINNSLTGSSHWGKIWVDWVFLKCSLCCVMITVAWAVLQASVQKKSVSQTQQHRGLCCAPFTLRHIWRLVMDSVWLCCVFLIAFTNGWILTCFLNKQSYTVYGQHDRSKHWSSQADYSFLLLLSHWEDKDLIVVC